MATRIAHIREAIPLPQPTTPVADQLYLVAKRLFDILLAATLLLLLSPLLLMIALAVVIDSPGSVIFRQKRVLGSQAPGADDPAEFTFEFLKFRTMAQNADQTVHQRYVESLIAGNAAPTDAAGQKLYKLSRDPRITCVGGFLRKYSLDELPQLANILRGEMSFVGPRPAIPYEVRRYKPWHMHRLTVTQGLTGLWQVMGRNELSFDEMVQLDIEYARSRSLVLDLKILFATLPAVLAGRGAS